MAIATLDLPLPVETASGPLTSEHRRELANARDRIKKIRKTAAVAAFNGWATALIAMLSAPFALFSAAGFLTTFALGLVAFNELRGRKLLLQFERRATAVLGWNQLGLLAMIVAYCLWTIYTSLYSANDITSQLHGYSELESTLGSLDDIDTLARQLVIIVYGSVIALSVVFQGLTAFYYFSRRKHLNAYIAETPEWIRELQRSQS